MVIAKRWQSLETFVPVTSHKQVLGDTYLSVCQCPSDSQPMRVGIGGESRVGFPALARVKMFTMSQENKTTKITLLHFLRPKCMGFFSGGGGGGQHANLQ